MSVICPKCNYQRSPADQTPDYECPNCGVVYSKVKAVEGQATKTAVDSSEPPPVEHPPQQSSRSPLVYGIMLLVVIGAVVFYMTSNDKPDEKSRSSQTISAGGGSSGGQVQSGSVVGTALQPAKPFSPDGIITVDLPVTMSPIDTYGSFQAKEQKSYRGMSEAMEAHVSTVVFDSFFELDLDTTWRIMEVELIIKRFAAVDRNIKHRYVEDGEKGLRKKIISGNFYKQIMGVLSNKSQKMWIEGALIAKGSKGWAVLVITKDPALRLEAAKIIKNIRIAA